MEYPIKIEDIILDFINSKVDKYDNKQSYFKITKQVSKNKVKKISKTLVGLVPFWTSEDGQNMVRIKTRDIPIDLKSGVSYKCNFELNHFDLKTRGLTGYYPRFLNATPTTNTDVDDNNSVGSTEH